MPLSKLLLETDSPYFPPGGHKRDVSVSLPGDILYLAEQVAALKKISLHEVLTANLHNVKEIYGVVPHTVVNAVRMDTRSEVHRLNNEDGVEVVRAKLEKVEQNTNIKCELKKGSENSISKISHVKTSGDSIKGDVEMVKAKFRKESIASFNDQQIKVEEKRNNTSPLWKSPFFSEIDTVKYNINRPGQCRGAVEDDNVPVFKAKFSKVK